MYRIDNKKVKKLEMVTFSEIGMQESDIEEILRCNIEILCDDEDEESMLIVGRQVENEKRGRSDLTAVDNNGNMVLIEVKRDRRDIESRREAFEFQAIRYAASYATIESPDELVEKVYVPYIEKYRSEFEHGDLTSYEFASRKLNDFLRANDCLNNFNNKQRIILVASDYDEQTLSAVAWLNSNDVNISCYKLTPYIINDEIYLKTDKLLPVTNYDDYYVNLMNRSPDNEKKKKSVARRLLPKIDVMLDWGVVKAGDIIVAKGREDEATLLSNGNVDVDGTEMSLQAWLKDVYGWSSVQTYAFAVHKESGKLLSEIRKEYMEKLTIV